MKNYIFLLTLTLNSFFVFSQSSDWKIIGTPSPISVTLQYQASDGTLFGEMPTSNKVFSFQLTMEIYGWSLLITSIYLIIIQTFITQFKENKNGEIYFYSGNKLYVFDKENLRFNELINFNPTGSNSEIRDFTILHNGDIRSWFN